MPEAYIKYLSEHLPVPAYHRIYFDHGSETLDQHYEHYQLQADSVMKAGGYDASNWMTRTFPGQAHTEDAWAERLEIPVLFLLERR